MDEFEQLDESNSGAIVLEDLMKVLKLRQWSCTDQELNTVAKEMIQCGDTTGTGSVDLQADRCGAMFT